MKSNNPGCNCFYGYIIAFGTHGSFPPNDPILDPYAFRLCGRNGTNLDSPGINPYNRPKIDARTQYSDSTAQWIGIDTDNRRIIGQVRSTGRIHAKAVEGSDSVPLFESTTDIAGYTVETIKYHGSSGYTAAVIIDPIDSSLKCASFNPGGALLNGPYEFSGSPLWNYDVDDSGDIYYTQFNGSNTDFYRNGAVIGTLPTLGLHRGMRIIFCANSTAYTIVFNSSSISDYRVVEIPNFTESVCDLDDLGFFSPPGNIYGVFYDANEEIFEMLCTSESVNLVGGFTLDGDVDTILLSPYAGFVSLTNTYWMVKYDSP